MTDIAQLAIRVNTLEMEAADRKMQGLGKTGQWLEGVIGKAMAAFASYKIAEFIKNSATLAARYETLGVVMGVVGNNAGYTSQQMENYAKALQETGISMVESRNTLAIMAQAHIDLAKATELGREAQDAAVIGNINSSEAFQRMIYGIQSGQTDVLRTIGINVNFEQSYAQLAATLGKTTKELDENEKATARMNAVLARAPALAGSYEASMGTAGKQLLSMQRYAEDLQVVLGDMFGGALQVGVEAVNSGLKDMKDWLDKNAVAAAVVRDNLSSAAENFVGLVSDVVSAGQDMSDELLKGVTWAEVLSSYLSSGMALVRDVANSALGIVKMVVGNIETVVLLLPKLEGELLKLAGIKLPKWINPDTYWGSARALANSGADQYGPKYIREQMYGKDDASNPARFSDQGYKRQSGSVAAILEQQRIWEAQHTKKPGGGGSTGRDKYADELTKLREEYLKLTGAESDAYRLEMEHSGFKGRQLEILVQEHDRIADLQQQKEDVSAWEDAYLKREEARVQNQIENAKAERSAAALVHEEIERKGEAYNSAMQIITPYWSQIQGIAQSETVLNQALRDGTITMEAYLVGMQNLQNSAPVITEAFGDLRNTIQDFSYQATDYLLDFCFTGKASFSDLVTSMLRDLARLAMQQNVTAPLAGWLSGAVSSLFGSGITGDYSDVYSGAFSAPAAEGGYRDGSKPYLVGEKGPEVFVPSSSGTIVPNNKLGSTNVQTSISVNVSSDGKTDAKTQAQGATNLSRDLEAAVIQIVQKHQRVGGALA